MLCSEHAAKLLRHIHPHPPGESAYCKDTCPKASVPAFGQWLEIHPANSKLRVSRYAGLPTTHGLAPTLRLGLSKQEMAEMGRFRPRPSPCLSKGRCSIERALNDELPDTKSACRTKSYKISDYDRLRHGFLHCSEPFGPRYARILPPTRRPPPAPRSAPSAADPTAGRGPGHPGAA